MAQDRAVAERAPTGLETTPVHLQALGWAGVESWASSQRPSWPNNPAEDRELSTGGRFEPGTKRTPGNAGPPRAWAQPTLPRKASPG